MADQGMELLQSRGNASDFIDQSFLNRLRAFQHGADILDQSFRVEHQFLQTFFGDVGML